MLPINYVIFYGTLMGDPLRRNQLKINDQIKLVGDISLLGSMYELPTCPGFIPKGERLYQAELYQILEPKILDILDSFEEYFPLDKNGSRFLREQIWVSEFNTYAWIYYLNPKYLPQGSNLIEYISWDLFVTTTRKALPIELPN